jgi:D-sedoheptulose 7-phosphate isomerase
MVVNGAILKSKGKRTMTTSMADYQQRLVEALKVLPVKEIELFFSKVLDVWKKNAQIFVCGNGGSAANAMHLVNDLVYGIAKERGEGIRAHALTANQSVMTCLANDVSYEEVFSKQLELFANSGDLLIVLSGSGNSPNILSALRKARELGVASVGLIGYSGGDALKMVDLPIHVCVHDMQIAEDIQTIIGHALMQWLGANNPHRKK